MKKIISVTREISEKSVEEAAADNAIESSSAEKTPAISDLEARVGPSDTETGSAYQGADEDDGVSILVYIEHIDNLQIHGWVIDYDNNPLNLSLRIGNDSYQISYTWLERTDIAGQLGEEFLRSGFRIEIPQGLTEVFELAHQDGKHIDVIANGIILHNKVVRKAAANEATVPQSVFQVADEKDISKDVQTRNDESFGIGQDGKGLESIQDTVVLKDAEGEDGHQIQKNTQDVEIKDDINSDAPITDDTNRSINPSGDGLPSVFENSNADIGGQAASDTQIVETDVAALDSGEAAVVETAIASSLQENATPVATSLNDPSLDKNGNPTDTGHKSDGTAIDGAAAIIGHVERIESIHIYGWVIDKYERPLKLAVHIGDLVYQVSPLWLMRIDIAEAFGDEFLQSGFKIEIPQDLVETFLLARQNAKTIDVVANNATLQNKAEPLNLKADFASSKALQKKASKKTISIKGYVESIDNLKIHGWVFNQEQTPLKLFLRIGDVSYSVVPEWYDRFDIAGQFGEKFLQSGFRILVPKELIDKYLQVCEHAGSIDVVANDVILVNNSQKVVFDPYSLGSELASDPNKFQTIYEINAEAGFEVGAEDFDKLLSAEIAFPLRVSRNNALNARYYLELAKQKLVAQENDTDTARTLLKISLAFGRRAEVLELLGNTYFEQQDYEAAAAHYEAAMHSEGKSGALLVPNLMHCKKLAAHPRAMVEVLLEGIDKNPESGAFREHLDGLLHEYWLKQQGRFEALAVVGDRAGLSADLSAAAAFIYGAYLRFYGAAANPAQVGGCNLGRVLIVGDFHIPQCVRYRIDQKIEQLESLGKAVTAVSWTELAAQQNALAFHDLVIFYRVPAEPAVLKAMAQVNATGRLSLYEIDDLLFDAAYPPPIETYGGYLGLETYLQLMKGMASFNAAAHYCRFGLASTQALADKLQPLVFGGRCYLHRNGIDALNQFKHKSPDPDKATIDIFYGSGTMAHNSDFADLALPAVSRLLDENPKVSLKIAGYLKLPEAFLADYGGRVKQMPPVKSVKAYWSMLERADINLAVLHDDEVNGCKSELKWFEAACLGIPSVVSTTANYRDIINDGEDGFIAATGDDWYRHLKRLVDDPGLRQTVAANAQARVRAEYSVEALADNLASLLADAVDAAGRPGGRPRKKIALVNVFFPPQSIGGATRVIADNFDLLQRDYQDRFEISVFTTDADLKTPYQMTTYNHQGARVYRASILWRENMDWHPTDEPMGELFSDYLEAEQPDLVHFHCVQRLTGSVVEAARTAGIPYIVTVHDAWWISDYQFLVDANHAVYPDGHPDPYLPRPLPSNVSLLDSVERLIYLKDLLHGAQAVLTVSNCFANIYRKNDIPQIRVNKNGISETLEWKAKDTRHTDKVVCGHVGGMAEHKGYFLLKAAVESVQPGHLEMLVVDHSQDEGYRLETHWGQVPVTVIGRTAQTRVVDLYRQIDVLFAPSTWPESYGLVTREAAACGCWVVASGMGGIGEDVVEDKSGFVIEPTLEALAGCLAQIDQTPAIFKGNARPPKSRRVSEQVRELASIYLNEADVDTQDQTRDFDFETIFEINAEFGQEISAQDFDHLKNGLITFPLRISFDETLNMAFYLELAKSALDSHDIEKAVELLRFALGFEETEENTGNIEALPELVDPVTVEDFSRLMDGETAYPLRISENDGINANYHFELAKHNLASGNIKHAMNLLRVGLVFGQHAEIQQDSHRNIKQIDFKTVFKINAKYGVEINIEDFSKLLSGQVGSPLRVSRNNALNARYYLELAKPKLVVQENTDIDTDTDTARTLLKISLAFGRRAEVLELLGNTYFEQQDYEAAAAHYEAAIDSEGEPSKWLISNLMHCKKLAAHPRAMVEVLLEGIDKNPESGAFRERLDGLLHEYWLKQQGRFEALAVVGDRAGLADRTAAAAAFIYGAYLRFYGAAANPAQVGGCNLGRVLIVGDFHIPQCVRYRIDQKIEQLESLGKAVTAVSWTELAAQQNALAFHDLVIFYRVPAEPAVLKAMAQVNATGRLSLYEIDDLLFDAAYPPPIETYGGYLGLETYLQLMKGMASFNAAAHYCRFGLASTQALADKLQPLVFGGRCYLHRNGIDALNQFKHKSPDPDKATIDIFYGSGTMAHNSDFADLALPAVSRLLDENPKVSLKIAGYLKLPEAFLADYGGRVKQMPPVKSVKAYWSMLERADINLAVLHDDEVNGCKSELKWFEAACLGIPSVVSTTANYRDIINDGEDGFIAATGDDWYRHLKRLVDDPGLRQTVAANAQARVRAEYSVEALADNLASLLADAVDAAGRPGGRPRKKIALVNVFFPPQSIGGATRVIADNFDLLQRDYQDRFEISVFTTDADLKTPYQMTTYNHQGARVYRASILWRENMDWHPTDEPMGELFSDYLEAEQPDLVHFHCVQRLTGSVVEAARTAGIPYIVTVHDAWWISDYQFLVDANHAVYPDGHPDPYLPRPLPSNVSLLDSVERLIYLKDLLHGAQAVLTVSNCFANIYRKNDIPQIRVNKNGISETLEWKAKDTRHTDKVVCGHVGGMAEHKGYFLLKAAVESVQPGHLEMLVVDHSQDEGYRLETHWGQVPVTVIGRTAQTRVVDLYRQIDVLFAPSTWPESYGLVTREAAACGCWVVASGMGGIGEDVVEDKSGFVIEPTLEALAGCLAQIDQTPAIFKGNARPPKSRRVSEQVRELAEIYVEAAKLIKTS
ncbi:glycosyltransferase [Methylovulum sp.]|uniref:glycosyltransferase n=1 Tax=Methylovulum sp. TaxID=1916980 RepID=UPI0026301C15|nr:glycosyltransferase [Methylovulum sp.]MDD5124255.1 glycosyltransferase [Methylovulum sp.]